MSHNFLLQLIVLLLPFLGIIKGIRLGAATASFLHKPNEKNVEPNDDE
jgi:hypothetical protein